MQVVLNVEGSNRTIGRGRDREVVSTFRILAYINLIIISGICPYALKTSKLGASQKIHHRT